MSSSSFTLPDLSSSSSSSSSSALQSATSSVVFAKVTVLKIDPSGPHAQAIEAYVRALTGAVDQAYRYVLSNPLLGPYATLDGHTRHWIELWNIYLKTQKIQLMPAAFGYVIESLVSNDSSRFRAQKPAKLQVVTQFSKGTTRPDMVLMDDEGEVAWIDFTASASAEHIFKQKVGWAKVRNVAEIAYPTTSMSIIGTLDPDPKGFDSHAIRREIEFQKYYVEQVNKALVELGEEIFAQKKVPRADPVLKDEKRKEWTRDILRKSLPFKDADLSDEAITLILAGLGLIPSTYGFRGSTSKIQGQQRLRYLLDIPKLTAPKETIRFSLSSAMFGSPEISESISFDAPSSSSSSSQSLSLVTTTSRRRMQRASSSLMFPMGARAKPPYGMRLRDVILNLETMGIDFNRIYSGKVIFFDPVRQQRVDVIYKRPWKQQSGKISGRKRFVVGASNYAQLPPPSASVDISALPSGFLLPSPGTSSALTGTSSALASSSALTLSGSSSTAVASGFPLTLSSDIDITNLEVVAAEVEIEEDTS